MACSGCAQRRGQIGQAVKAVASGNMQAAAQNMHFVGQSLTRDIAAVATSARQSIFGKPKLR